MENLLVNVRNADDALAQALAVEEQLGATLSAADTKGPSPVLTMQSEPKLGRAGPGRHRNAGNRSPAGPKSLHQTTQLPHSLWMRSPG